MAVSPGRLHVLSLCSGAGGLELGLRLAAPGARVVCYVEREVQAAGILGARMQDGLLDEAPVWTDLHAFDGRPWRGVVDCVTGGYPCQPFSSAGKQLGTADPRHLWPDIRRIVGEVRPRWCFFENVAQHLRVGFREVRLDLRSMGYVVAAGLFSAAELGAPHLRERLFVLAYAPRGTGQRVEGERAPLRDFPPINGAEGFDAFPPGPADRDAWDALLSSRPEVEPALCRVADGLAGRVDRLRATGNGVVPVVAAKAFVSLRRELGMDE